MDTWSKITFDKLTNVGVLVHNGLIYTIMTSTATASLFTKTFNLSGTLVSSTDRGAVLLQGGTYRGFIPDSSEMVLEGNRIYCTGPTLNDTSPLLTRGALAIWDLDSDAFSIDFITPLDISSDHYCSKVTKKGSYLYFLDYYNPGSYWQQYMGRTDLEGDNITYLQVTDDAYVSKEAGAVIAEGTDGLLYFTITARLTWGSDRELRLYRVNFEDSIVDYHDYGTAQSAEYIYGLLIEDGVFYICGEQTDWTPPSVFVGIISGYGQTINWVTLDTGEPYQGYPTSMIIDDRVYVIFLSIDSAWNYQQLAVAVLSKNGTYYYSAEATDFSATNINSISKPLNLYLYNDTLYAVVVSDNDGVVIYYGTSDMHLIDNSTDEGTGAEVITQEGQYLDYPAQTDWVYETPPALAAIRTPTQDLAQGYHTFYFKPEANDGPVTLLFENIDPTNPCYIDAVQMEPDFTGKHPSDYRPGPDSTPPEAHADTHATDGADEITPASIGAETPAGAQAKADAVEVAANAYTDTQVKYYEPLTNGNESTPELLFGNGDVIMVEVV